MPKTKLTKMTIYNTSQLNYPCQFCGYYTKSETAMRLHRKSRHGITVKYNKEGESGNLVYICTGCKKPKKNCKCHSH